MTSLLLALLAASGTVEPPVHFSYRIHGSMHRQAIEGTTEVTIAKGAQWTVTEVQKSPLGDETTTVTLDGKTLLPRTESVKGPVAIELSFDQGTVKGALTQGNETSRVDAKTDQVLLVDGAALAVWVGALPLANGYQSSAATYDPMSGKIEPLSLTVAGQEKVTVPAGTFDAWKVRIASTTGTTTLWIEKGGAHRALKAVSSLAMGLGRFSQELEK